MALFNLSSKSKTVSTEEALRVLAQKHGLDKLTDQVISDRQLSETILAETQEKMEVHKGIKAQMDQSKANAAKVMGILREAEEGGYSPQKLNEQHEATAQAWADIFDLLKDKGY
jgi:hypothetical protein